MGLTTYKYEKARLKKKIYINFFFFSILLGLFLNQSLNLR
jgi:hypothetical protein